MSDEATLAGFGTAFLSSELDSEGPYTIHGVALGADDITVGQSGVKKLWPASELQDAAESLAGQPLVRDHTNTVDGVIGEVLRAKYKQGVGVLYEAQIAPQYEELAHKVADGLLEVSVRAYHTPTEELSEDDDTGAKVVEDISFDNLSVVTKGASPSNTAEIGAAADMSASELKAAFDHDADTDTETTESDADVEPDSTDVSDDADTSESAGTVDTDAEAEPSGETPAEPESEPEGDAEASVEQPNSDSSAEAEASADDGSGDPATGTDTETATETDSLADEDADVDEASGSLYSELTVYHPTMTDELEEKKEQIEEMSSPAVLEQSELEELREKADRADELDGKITEMTGDLADLKENQEVLDEVDEEALEALRDADTPEVVESSTREEELSLVEEAGQIYAEELAEDSMFDADELQERWTPSELKEKALAKREEATDEESLTDDDDPEPKGGEATEEELEDDEDELSEEEAREQARERVAQDVEEAGWDEQARKIREDEISLEEMGVEVDY